MIAICQLSHADALLIDAYNNADPTSYTSWVDAGVTEDISTAAGGTILTSGAVFNIGTMTASVTGESGSFNGGVPANPMLNDYHYVNSGTATVSIGGFEDGSGNAQTMTSTLNDMATNTFTLLADQDYKLYLFGAGDNDGQDTTFTFDSVSKTTSPTIIGAAEDSHFVTYDFTTGSDLTGFTLDFTFTNNTSAFGAWNGLALVAVPEPSSFGLIAGALALGAVMIRRQARS
ncbi:MAG: PEP-CTERM sorting domain-containing protein [Opitutaceae bacterium]